MNKFINVLDSSDIRYFQDELNPSDWVDISNYRQMTKEEVLKIIQEEKNNKVIRQTSAIFDTKKLGYTSSLVAFEIEEQDIDKAVEILNSHPGISHNYERNHKYNIWF